MVLWGERQEDNGGGRNHVKAVRTRYQGGRAKLRSILLMGNTGFVLQLWCVQPQPKTHSPGSSFCTLVKPVVSPRDTLSAGCFECRQTWCRNSDRNTPGIGKRSSAPDIIFVPHCLVLYFESDTVWSQTRFGTIISAVSPSPQLIICSPNNWKVTLCCVKTVWRWKPSCHRC